MLFWEFPTIIRIRITGIITDSAIFRRPYNGRVHQENALQIIIILEFLESSVI